MKQAPQGPLTGRLADMFPGFSTAGDALKAIIERNVPKFRVEGSGATSDLEFSAMQKAFISLKNQPGANEIIAQTMRAKAQIDIERGRVVDAYQAGRIDLDEAQERMYELDSRSIMSPQLQQLIEQAGGGQDLGSEGQGGDPLNLGY